MDIAKACRTLRQCNDSYVLGSAMPGTCSEVAEAVRVLNAFLERARGDGKPIRELGLADALLCTPDGMRLVMPFVFSAESIAAVSKRRPQRAS